MGSSGEALSHVPVEFTHLLNLNEMKGTTVYPMKIIEDVQMCLSKVYEKFNLSWQSVSVICSHQMCNHRNMNQKMLVSEDQLFNFASTGNISHVGPREESTFF